LTNTEPTERNLLASKAPFAGRHHLVSPGDIISDCLGDFVGIRTEVRAEAAAAVRSLISEVRLVPENGKLEIEIAGDLASILALASGSKKPVIRLDDGLQTTLVAGKRNHLYRTELFIGR
jgi:hypothetical protein